MSFQTIFPITLRFLQQIIKSSTDAFRFQSIQLRIIIWRAKVAYFLYPFAIKYLLLPQLDRQVIREITLLLCNLCTSFCFNIWASISNVMRGLGASKKDSKFTVWTRKWLIFDTCIKETIPVSKEEHPTTGSPKKLYVPELTNYWGTPFNCLLFHSPNIKQVYFSDMIFFFLAPFHSQFHSCRKRIKFHHSSMTSQNSNLMRALAASVEGRQWLTKHFRVQGTAVLKENSDDLHLIVEKPKASASRGELEP